MANKFRVIRPAHKCQAPLEAIALTENIERIKAVERALKDVDPKMIAETTEQGRKILFCLIENLRLARQYAVTRLRNEFLSVEKN